ncbi:hypothetical protein CCP2SC5_170003 [Azospirillaceae bacterium]
MANILIVDDVPEVRANLRLVLEMADHTVSEAEDGQMALTILENTTFDLVITDVLMPKLDGIEVTKRTHLLRPEARILVISGGDRNVPPPPSPWLQCSEPTPCCISRSLMKSFLMRLSVCWSPPIRSLRKPRSFFMRS